MKTAATLPVLLAIGCLGTAAGLPQKNGPLQIQWQKSFGGTSNDHLKTAVATSDGGYLLLGGSTSAASLSPTQGNKTSPVYGGRDFWVVRLDAEGNKLWDASFGGMAWESPMDAVELSDGGWLLAGYSLSEVGGTKTSPNHESPGSSDNGYMDFWIVRIDKDGKQLWDKAIGSTLFDRCDGVLSVEADGGFLLGGYSKGGVSGDRTTPSRGEYDYWLVRVDASGNPLWDKAFGGTGIDLCYGLRRTPDGGAILIGASSSPASGDRTSPSYGGDDAWVVRLDASGNKLWDRSYGGSSVDGGADALPMADGGFLLPLISGSRPASGVRGNKTSPFFGTVDAWLVRIDANGSPLWERAFGGTGTEAVYQTLAMPDGGFLAVCNSNSKAGGNKTAPNQGGYDLWLVRMDAAGNKLWDQTFGGTGPETNGDDDSTPNYPRVILTPDGGALLCGTSASPPSGNKTSPLFGGKDFWVLKLGPEPPFLRVREMQPEGLPLTIIAPPNCNYVIQCASACSGSASDWTDLATVANPTGLMEWVDTEAASASMRFYRAVKLLPNLQ